VSGTAALWRTAALAAVSTSAIAFDPAFASYHEDLDLGLGCRLGWRSAWVGGAPTATSARRAAPQCAGATVVDPRQPLALAGRQPVGLAPCSGAPRLLRGELRASAP
jgi:hypothetical protein